jgi:hypothetical protein
MDNEVGGIAKDFHDVFIAGQMAERLRCARLCMLISEGYEQDLRFNRHDRWAAGGSAAAVECAQRIEAGQKVD